MHGKLASFCSDNVPNSEECFFQQDNAPCHTARSVKVWMKDHHIRTLSWPAQSPDLNPVEKLWNVIKRKMDGHKPSNKAELLEFLRQKQYKVTQRQCERQCGEHAKTHESCDFKSRLFHQILISDLFLS